MDQLLFGILLVTEISTRVNIAPGKVQGMVSPVTCSSSSVGDDVHDEQVVPVVSRRREGGVQATMLSQPTGGARVGQDQVLSASGPFRFCGEDDALGCFWCVVCGVWCSGVNFIIL